MLSAQPGDPWVADLRASYANTAQRQRAKPLQQLGSSWAELAELTGASPTGQRSWAGDLSFLEKWWDTRAALQTGDDDLNREVGGSDQLSRGSAAGWNDCGQVRHPRRQR